MHFGTVVSHMVQRRFQKRLGNRPERLREERRPALGAHDAGFGVELRKVYDERDPAPTDWVFLNRDGKPWKSWRTAFRKALRDAGIHDFRFHDLRHCFGSYLGMNNTNPKAMMELMGHRRPEMTMRYTHLSVEYKRQAVGKLPSFGDILESESPQISPSAEEAKVVNFGK